MVSRIGGGGIEYTASAGRRRVAVAATLQLITMDEPYLHSAGRERDAGVLGVVRRDDVGLAWH